MVDTVIIKSPDTPTEDPKHIEAMVAKADGAGKPPTDEQLPVEAPEDDDRPDWLPEKFKSAQDMAKAYAELEAKLGQPKADNKPTDTANQKQAEEQLQAKGLDFTEFSQEFSAKGELSDDSYKKLQEAGFPKEIVDQYIEGQRARAALYETEVKSLVGGDEGFGEMVEWAKANLQPAEILAYNQAIDSGDLVKAKLAVSGVYQRFQTARGSEPRLLNGGNGGASADVYESVPQLQKDMANPQYKSDPAFRRKVQEKLARSNIL